MSGTMSESAAWLPVLLGALAGYLCGSIPFGLLLTRMAGLGDIRAIGSGNIGATNVLRTGNKGLAAATVLLDALKGTVPVLVAGLLFGPAAALAAAAGAFLGHVAPVWLGFRGGKGVATFIGGLLGLDWRAALAFAIIWLAAAGISRYSSLAALIASALSPFFLYGLGDQAAAVVMACVVAILFAKHHANIARLLAGTEGRIGQKG